MLFELGQMLPGFLGQDAQSRCLCHIIQLIAKVQLIIVIAYITLGISFTILLQIDRT